MDLLKQSKIEKRIYLKFIIIAIYEELHEYLQDLYNPSSNDETVRQAINLPCESGYDV